MTAHSGPDAARARARLCRGSGTLPRGMSGGSACGLRALRASKGDPLQALRAD
jgi:hypothetical protein